MINFSKPVHDENSDEGSSSYAEEVDHDLIDEDL